MSGIRLKLAKSWQETLDDRRPSQGFAFEAGGLRYTRSFSRFPDGRLAEIFLNSVGGMP